VFLTTVIFLLSQTRFDGKLYEKLLVLNDKIGVIKFCYDRKTRHIVLSLEIPWHGVWFAPSTLFDCLEGLSGVAAEYQRSVVSAGLALHGDDNLGESSPITTQSPVGT